MNATQLAAINKLHLHQADKYYRMFAGLASELTAYENQTLYITVRYSARWKKDANTTAKQIAGDWYHLHKKEFTDAVNFQVRLIELTKGDTGFNINLDQLKAGQSLDQLISQMKLAMKNTEEKGKHVLAFGLLSKD